MSTALVLPPRRTAGDLAAIDHPSGYLALSARNQRFTMNGVPGFIAYREHGRHLVMSGGVHAPVESQGELLTGLEELARQRGRRLMAVQVRASQVDLFASRRFTVNQMGSSFTLALDRFSYAGTARLKLRNKISRARRSGLRVLELGREVPRDRAAFALLRLVSEAWIKAKRKKELDFMIGELGEPEHTERRIFLVVDPADRPLGFITYVPVWGSRPGLLHDLTRKVPDAPPGTMELCNATALERFQRERLPYLHFGFTPFIVGDADNPGRSRVVSWLVGKLRRHGSAVYPAETQAAYKLKWGADIIEPEYIAARPLGLRAIWDLLLLTRSL